MGSYDLPDGYLEFCSLAALESLALSRMNRAEILRKEAKLLLTQLVRAEAEAQIVRWTLTKRRSQGLRNGAGTQLRSAAGSVALPVGTLFEVVRSSGGGCRRSTSAVFERQSVSDCQFARRAVAIVRVQKFAVSVCCASGRGARLTRLACETPGVVSRAKLPADMLQVRGVDSIVSRDEVLAALRAASNPPVSDARPVERCHPQRGHILVPMLAVHYGRSVVHRGQSVLRTAATDRQPTVRGLKVSRLKRSTSLAGRGGYPGLFLVTSASVKSRPIRTDGERRLAPAS